MNVVATPSPKKFALVCVCGTYWTQRDLDEYNNGDPVRAMERHQFLWEPGGEVHKAAE